MSRNYSNIPFELANFKQWVCWGWKGRPLKMPVNPKIEKPAKAGIQETWGTFTQAVARINEGKCSGIGFEFTQSDGLVGIDLDHCIEGNRIFPEAAEWIQQFNSYTEVSQSGTGIHIICKGSLPGKAIKSKTVEMYDSSRFFALTGNVYNNKMALYEAQKAINSLYGKLVAAREKKQGDPTDRQSSNLSLDDSKLLKVAANAQNGSLFCDLFQGKYKKKYGSQSEADLALCNILAFYTDKDAARMDRLFRQSALMREKWDRSQSGTTYGAITIQNAIDHCSQVFDPRTTAEQDLEKPQILTLSNVTAQRVDWLWKPYIPLGKITLLEADPGTGKTYLCLALASVVSSGEHFYMEPKELTKQPAKVIYQTAEDGIADTIVPRLQGMIPSPNLQNISTIDDREKGLTFLDERIESALKITKPKLFVLDPLQAYLGAKVDMHRANEVRPVMAHIAGLAEKYNCAFVMIMHMNKNALGEQAMYRGLGSIDIPAVARSMLFLGRNPQNKEERVLCHIKSSLAAPGPSLTFNISPEFGGVVFTGTTNLDYKAITSPQPTRNKPAITLTEAINALGGLLGEDGFATIEQIETLKNAAGISKSTMYNAKSELALHSVSIGQPPHRKTYWVDPDLDIAKFKFDHTPPPLQEKLNLLP